MKRSLGTFLLAVCCLFVNAQKNKDISEAVKFGNIFPLDFAPKVYGTDTNAQAVILYDVGRSEFNDGNHGDFTLLFSHHLRARVMNKNGFDVATIKIPLFVKGSVYERIEDLEAVTYNLEDGKVVATKLDKSSVFYEKLNKYFKVAKFTFPNIKEGSIIEYRYKLSSPFYSNLQPWYFQTRYPVLWSEYSVGIPMFFQYVTMKQHYYKYDVEEALDDFKTFTVRVPGGINSDDVYSIRSSINKFHWVIKNLPALRDEDYISSEKNYVEKLEFQFTAETWPNQPIVDHMGTWAKLSQNLMKDEDFGGTLASNGWMKEEMPKIISGATTDLDKAKAIYHYLRDNIKCSGEDNELSQPLKKTFQSRMGNVADINLLMVSMFLFNNLEVKPVLLSTRDHGLASEVYPLFNKFNYVICQLSIGEKKYLLDASRPLLGFDRLGPDCYNGTGRLVGDNPLLVTLSPDSLTEKKHTSIFLYNEEKGGMSGSFNSQLGYFESYELREKVLKSGENTFFADNKKAYPFNIDYINKGFDSLKTYEEPVTVTYEFKFDPGTDDVIYFNPMMAEGYRENPFKAGTRIYGIEMPYKTSELYTLNMEVPKGYKIDELPESVRVKFNNNQGLFEYMLEFKSDGTIGLRCRLEFYKATFDPEDYESLRDFYGYVIKKQSEQIVFKKIK